MASWQYPDTRATDHVDVYHGVEVADPYRWLEETGTPEVAEWVRAQNELTRSVLDALPDRDRVRDRLRALWDFPRAWAPLKRGGRYFQLRNDGLQDQNVLVVLDALDAEPRTLLDPNAMAPDGTMALVGWSPSEDGRYVAYATSASGSDWMTWRIRRVETGEDLADEVRWSKFSTASWAPDGSGFYYSRYDAPEPGREHVGTLQFQKLYFHRVGTGQDRDRLVYERRDRPEWGFDAEATRDGRYLVLGVWVGTDPRNLLFVRELASDGPFREVVDTLEARFLFVGNVGSELLVLTDLDAPLGRLVAIDPCAPERDAWRTVVPERDEVLEHVVLAGDGLVAQWLRHAHHRLERLDLDGRPRAEIPLPPMGSLVDPVAGRAVTGSPGEDELFFAHQTFTTPTTVYRCRLPDGVPEVLHRPEIAFDPSRYETRQLFARSRDGTAIPLFFVGPVRPGQSASPTLLTGYGGFRQPVTPVFSPAVAVWLERGGVFASANLRGGGEYGKAWHDAGRLDRKQNVFDDFIACAETLVDEGITTPRQLAIWGASNGGLLVGACLAQRPELFGAAIPAVGVLDMLRFHRFTIGWAWVSDYGSSDAEADFRTLHAYSPLHNLQPGRAYPATLVLTGDHDDRVVPLHSFKFAAALQAAQAGPAPILLRVQTRAGHGAGKPTAVLIEEFADAWTFLEAALCNGRRTAAAS